MAVLAAYMVRGGAESLADFLDARIGATIGAPVQPDPADVAGFDAFFARHTEGLAIERAAIDHLAGTAD